MADKVEETRDALLVSLADAVEMVLRRINRGAFIDDDETAERLAESLSGTRYDYEVALRGQS